MSETNSPALFADLRARGLIYQTTNDSEIEKLLSDAQNPLVVYAGFDPTAPSLHVGNLLGLVALKRLQNAGHEILPMIGGATGFIGDPSGRASERSLLDPETLATNTAALKSYLQKFFGHDTKVYDNYDWWKKINTLDFLRDVGKHFTLGYILDKESVRSRLEAGISITESSYPLLQAYDFWHLFKKHNCRLQTGGSDQWGNITAGVDYIRRREQQEVFGLTTPLITTAGGQKFGKSAGNAIWLDAELTHPYLFYQFWVNSPDQEAIPLLKYFTFLSLDEIQALEKELTAAPEKRAAQKKLAYEMTAMIHGSEAADTAVSLTGALFSGREEDLRAICSGTDANWLPQAMPSSDIKSGTPLLDALVSSGLTTSKRQAREDLAAGAIYLNGERCDSEDKNLTSNDCLSGSRYILLRKGKKTYHLLTCTR